MRKILSIIAILTAISTSSFAQKPIDIDDIPGEAKKPIELWPAKKSCAETAISALVGDYEIINGPAKVTISVMGRKKTLRADAAITIRTATFTKKGKKLKFTSKVFGDMRVNFRVTKCKKNGYVYLRGKGRTTLGDVGTVPISMELVASYTDGLIIGSLKWRPVPSSMMTSDIAMTKTKNFTK